MPIVHVILGGLGLNQCCLDSCLSYWQLLHSNEVSICLCMHSHEYVRPDMWNLMRMDWVWQNMK